MTLAHPEFSRCIEFAENTVNVLVVENQPLLRRVVTGLLSQVTCGDGGEFVLSDEHSIIELGKTAEFITDLFCINMAERRFQTRINQEAVKLCCTELEEETARLLTCANRLGAALAVSLDFNADYTAPSDLSSFLKLLDLHIDSEVMTLPERMLEYMKLCRRFFGKKLFIFLNLKSFLSDKELELFYGTVMYEKFDILLIEGIQRGKTCSCERVYIIDSDRCEI